MHLLSRSFVRDEILVRCIPVGLHQCHHLGCVGFRWMFVMSQKPTRLCVPSWKNNFRIIGIVRFFLKTSKLRGPTAGLLFRREAIYCCWCHDSRSMLRETVRCWLDMSRPTGALPMMSAATASMSRKASSSHLMRKRNLIANRLCRTYPSVSNLIGSLVELPTFRSHSQP